jgi:hypothetical protein
MQIRTYTCARCGVRVHWGDAHLHAEALDKTRPVIAIRLSTVWMEQAIRTILKEQGINEIRKEKGEQERTQVHDGSGKVRVSLYPVGGIPRRLGYRGYQP